MDLAQWEVRALLRDVPWPVCTPETFTRVPFDDVTLSTWPPRMADPFWTDGYGYDVPPWVVAHLETMSETAPMLRLPRRQESLLRLRGKFFEACNELLLRMAALPDRPKRGSPLSEAARQAFHEVNSFVGEVTSYAETAAYANALLVGPGTLASDARELLLLYLWRGKWLPDDAKTARGETGKRWGGKRAPVIRYDALREYVNVRREEYKALRRKWDQSKDAKDRRKERREDPNVLKREAVAKAKARERRRKALASKETHVEVKVTVDTLDTTTGASNDTTGPALKLLGGGRP